MNCEDLSERLHAMSILAAICVEQPERATVATDSLAGDVSRRIMKSNIALGVVHQLMEKFVASALEQEKEHICLILERVSVSSEFESQLRTHDPEYVFFTDDFLSSNGSTHPFYLV